jgi:hypothetical protein
MILLLTIVVVCRYGCRTLLFHTRPNSPRDGAVPASCAVILQYAVFSLRFGLPMLLCDPDLHRLGQGAVEAVDCSE